jgi:hypothetical protein
MVEEEMRTPCVSMDVVSVTTTFDTRQTVR